MASILKFVARSDSTGSRAAVEGKVATMCQIIIFPGVRYERRDEDGGKPSPRPKRSRRRRTRSR